MRDEADPLVAAMRIGQLDAVEALLQPRQVLFETEGLPRIHRDHLVDAVAEEEAAVHDRNLRPVGGQPFAIEEYPRCH